MKNEQIKTRTLLDIIVSHFYDKGAEHMRGFFEDDKTDLLFFTYYGEKPELWKYTFKEGEIDGAYGFEEGYLYDVKKFVEEGRLVSAWKEFT